MLILPPTLTPAGPADPYRDHDAFHFIEPTMPKRNALVPFAVILSLLLLLAALVWVLMQ